MILKGSPAALDKETAPIPLMTIKDNHEALKVVQKEDRLRLNIGCDRSEIAGYVGVDFNPDVDPDILAEADDLNMIESDTVDEIYASHVLEHLPYGNTALQEWLRVLKPGGMLTVIVPDLMGVYMMSQHHGVWGAYSQPIDETYVNACVFGASLLSELIPEMKDLYNGPGHVHRQIFIEGMLLKRVVEAGFPDARESPDTMLGPIGMGNRCVIATKPIPQGE